MSLLFHTINPQINIFVGPLIWHKIQESVKSVKRCSCGHKARTLQKVHKIAEKINNGNEKLGFYCGVSIRYDLLFNCRGINKGSGREC